MSFPVWYVRRCPICSDDPDIKLPKAAWECRNCSATNKTVAMRRLATDRPKVGHRRTAICANCEEEKQCWEDDFLCLQCRFEVNTPFINDGHTATISIDRGKINVEVHCPQTFRDGDPDIKADCAMSAGGTFVGCLVAEEVGWQALESYSDPYGHEMPITSDDMAIEWFYDYYDYEEGETIFYWRFHDEYRRPVEKPAISEENELAEPSRIR